MIPPSSMQAKTSILLFLMVAFGSAGNVLLSKGMKEIGEVNQWSGAALAGIFSKVLTNGWIWLGIGFQLVAHQPAELADLPVGPRGVGPDDQVDGPVGEITHQFLHDGDRRMYREALENGWISGSNLVDQRGVQVSALSYPHLAHTEIFNSVESFYRRFYFRPRKIFAIAGEMVRDPHVLKRRLREGVEFLRFLSQRREV